MLAIDLTGRKALVTGGSRGIGAGIVRALAEAGAAVCFTYSGSQRGAEAAKQLVDQLAAEGMQVFPMVARAEDMGAMEQAAREAAERMGGLDIIVPNVGMNWVAPLEQLDLASWERSMKLNLTSAYIAAKVTLPYLEQAARGDIVIIGSSAAVDGGGGSAHYAAAKAGLEGMMYALMRELPRKGIHINVVHPCVVDTDLLRERYDTEEKRAALAAQVPIGRISTVQDIGALVAFLCSELGGFVCGQSILVDGGRTLWRGK